MMKHIVLVSLQLFVVLEGHGLGVPLGGDDDFARYLRTHMLSYPSWLSENHLDPSPPSTGKFILDAGEYNAIYLRCELSNVVTSGLSKSLTDNLTSYSDFDSYHTFGVWRHDLPTFDFHGSLTCSGAIKAERFPELGGHDFPFTGKGNFSISLNNSDETISFENVGITPEFSLDLTHSWVRYWITIYLENLRLTFDWDEELIYTKYAQAFEDMFIYLFRMEYLYLYRMDNFLPSGLLVERFLRETLEGVPLGNIMPPENLPSTYYPSPSTSDPYVPPRTSPTIPTTTSRYTVTTIVSSSSTVAVTGETPTTSTQDGTTTNSGAKLFAGRWLTFPTIFTTIILICVDIIAPNNIQLRNM